MARASHCPWHCEDTRREPDTVHESGSCPALGRLLLAVALGALILALPGCASTGAAGNKAGKNSAATALSAHLTEAPFEAPYDPGMGQVVVAVPEVAVSAPVTVSAGNLGQLVRSQLAGYLSRSANLIVADRETLTEIGIEHKLAESGATDPRDKPVAGRLAGARYLIKVDVTDFKEDVVGKAKGRRWETGGFFGILRMFVPGEAATVMDVASEANLTLGKGEETVHGIVGLEFRIVDVDTGALVKSGHATGTLTRQNTRSIIGIAGISMTDSDFEDSVVAQAMRSATQDAVRQIHAALRERAAATPRIAGPIGAGLLPASVPIVTTVSPAPTAK